MTTPPPLHAAAIKVVIVDDSPDLLAMLSAILAIEPDIKVVGTLSSADTLADLVSTHRPRVVLLDLTMPGKPPIDALREVKSLPCGAGVSVLAYSGYDDQASINEVAAAGASGFVSKATDPSQIAQRLRDAARSTG